MGNNMQQSDLANLPPDVQAQIASLLRQRGVSGQLMSSALAPTQNEVISGRVIPTGGGQILAKVLSAYFGNRGLEKADEGIAGIRQQDLERYSAEAGALTGNQSRAAIVQALASKDPRIAALAAGLQKRNDERAGKYADLKKGVDATGAANDFLNETPTPTGAFQQPEFKQLPGAPANAPPTLVNYGEGGRPNASQPASTNISQTNNLPGAEAGMALDTLKSDLKERKERAQIAKEALSSNRTALEAINAGAATGGLGSWAQTARKIAQGFGIEFDENTPTTTLTMALGNAVLAKARALAPVTGEDVKRLQEILGSLDTDPSALEKMISVYDGIAAKELQDFNKYVEFQANNLKTPYAKDLFSGAAIGLEPIAPGGNTGQGLRAIQEMAQRGGNPSQFAVGGEQIPSDARFDIQGTTSTTRGKPTAGAVPPAQMTPAQRQARIKELEALLGGKP
jgi:hypothetical protein